MTELVLTVLWGVVAIAVPAAIFLAILAIIGVALWIDPREGGWFRWRPRANTR